MKRVTQHNMKTPAVNDAARKKRRAHERAANKTRRAANGGDPPWPVRPAVHVAMDLSPAGRYPSVRIAGAFQSLAHAGAHAHLKNVSVSVEDGFRTSKQAAPLESFFADQRADRTAPTRAQCANKGWTPRNSFAIRYDPIVDTFVHRDHTVPDALAILHINKFMGLERPYGWTRFVSSQQKMTAGMAGTNYGR